jgi:acetolactate synthase I/II/III large subunit
VTENRVTGGDLLVEMMKEHRVEVAFGVVSVHNLPLVDAVDRHLRFVPVRHEAAAVNAADGYGRAAGTFGVAITSTGTGSGNAAGSLIESLSAGSSVLHMTGQIPSEHLGSNKGVIHETKDQLGMLAAVSKRACSIGADDDAASILREAIAVCRTAPGGPVSIEWPIDLQYARWSLGASPTESAESEPELDGEAITRAVELLAACERPLLWLGGGARSARTEVVALIDRIGAGVLTSNSGRGVLPEDDPRCIGNFATNPAVADLLGEADVLVSVGSHFRSNETKDYQLALPRPHVQVDIDPAALGRAYPCEVGIAGDAATVLRLLAERLTDHPDRTAWLDGVAGARAAARLHLREGIGAQAEICDAIRAVFPAESVIARDVTIPSSSWGNRLLELHDPHTNIFPRGGGIGQGLAMGIGAAVAQPDHPIAVLVGDGGLAVHLGELLTLAQEQPWLVVVLFNDGGYGVLRNMQDTHVGRRSGVDLVTPDFSRLCESMGIAHVPVDDAARAEAALRTAVDLRGPAVVEVDVDAIGAMPRPFIPPVPLPES